MYSGMLFKKILHKPCMVLKYSRLRHEEGGGYLGWFAFKCVLLRYNGLFLEP